MADIITKVQMQHGFLIGNPETIALTIRLLDGEPILEISSGGGDKISVPGREIRAFDKLFHTALERLADWCDQQTSERKGEAMNNISDALEGLVAKIEKNGGRG
jgi:hypothetical protein